MSSIHVMHATEVTESTRAAAITAVVALIVVIAVLYYLRVYRDTEAMTGDASAGRRKRQCYVDADCPDGTSCNSDGICTPRLSDLPVTKEESKPGRGREGERSTF